MRESKASIHISPLSITLAAIASLITERGAIISNTYSYKDFEKIITSIEKNYYPELNNFYLKMLKISTKIDSNRA